MARSSWPRLRENGLRLWAPTPPPSNWVARGIMATARAEMRSSDEKIVYSLAEAWIVIKG